MTPNVQANKVKQNLARRDTTAARTHAPTPPQHHMTWEERDELEGDGSEDGGRGTQGGVSASLRRFSAARFKVAWSALL